MNETKTETKPVAVGDIFEMSWGYDQTNVNYFQVTRLSKGGFFVREIGCESVKGTQGFMCEHVRPAVGKFCERSQWCGRKTRTNWQNPPEDNNPETFRKPYLFDGNYSFNFGGRYFARRINPTESTYSSWYA